MTQLIKTVHTFSNDKQVSFGLKKCRRPDIGQDSIPENVEGMNVLDECEIEHTEIEETYVGVVQS